MANYVCMYLGVCAWFSESVMMFGLDFLIRHGRPEFYIVLMMFDLQVNFSFGTCPFTSFLSYSTVQKCTLGESSVVFTSQ